MTGQRRTDLQLWEEAVRKPAVRIVVGNRGYGKSTLAARLPKAHPWSRDPGFYCMDTGPTDDPQLALTFFRKVSAYCAEYAPLVQPKLFLRTEQWMKLRDLRANASLLPAVFTLEPAQRPAQFSYIRDAYDNPVWAATDTAEPADWVQKQPEHAWLMAALPDEGYYKMPVFVALKRLHELRDRRPHVPTLDMQPRDFLEHCCIIGAIKRVEGPSIEWSNLWLEGCRELDKHEC